MKKIILFIVSLTMFNSVYSQCTDPTGSSTTTCSSCSTSYTTNQSSVTVSGGNIYCVASGNTVNIADLTMTNGKLVVCGTVNITSTLNFSHSSNAEIVVQTGGVLNIGTSSKTISFSLGSNTEGITVLGKMSAYSDITIDFNGFLDIYRSKAKVYIYGNLTINSNINALVNRGSLYVYQRSGSGGIIRNNNAGSTACLVDTSYIQSYNIENAVGQWLKYNGSGSVNARVNVINDINLNSTYLVNSTNNTKVYVCYGSLSVINTGGVNVPLGNINTYCTNPLPLDILSFTYNNGYLKWQVSNVVNVDLFEIEKSYDGINFEKINSLKYITNNFKYQVYDKDNEVCYYRLKIVDNDLKFEYSKIITNKVSLDKDISIIFTNESLIVKADNVKSVKVYDVTSKLLYSGGLEPIPIENLKGMILIKIETESNIINKKLIIE